MIRLPRRLRQAGILLPLAAALSACNSSAPPVAETPPPPVSVSQPVTRETVNRDEFEGRIAAVESVEVRARVRGHLIKISFQDGQMVEAGTTLFEIDPRPYQAAMDAAMAQKSAAEASLKLAKTEYARIETLVRTNAASREELDVWTAKQATSEAERLKAIAEVEQAQLDLDFTKVTAPIAGKTSRTQVTVGNLINASGGETLLTTITSVDPMYVYFDVDERAILHYRKVFGKGASGPRPAVKELKIPVEVGLEGEEGFPHRGVIDYTDNKINASTGTIQVRGVLPNSSRILDAGMRARVRVPIGDPFKAVMITERAVGNDQSRKFVYVVTDNNVAERRDVKLGRVVDGMQIITEGLAPGDWVIVNGIQRVRDAMTVAPKRVPMPGSVDEAKTPKEPAKPSVSKTNGDKG